MYHFLTAYPTEITGELESIPTDTGQRVGYTLNRWPVHPRVNSTGNHSCYHPSIKPIQICQVTKQQHKQKQNFASGKQSTYRKPMQAYWGQTNWEQDLSKFEPETLKLKGDSTNCAPGESQHFHIYLNIQLFQYRFIQTAFSFHFKTIFFIK